MEANFEYSWHLCSQLPASGYPCRELTHVHYAFANARTSGEVVLSDTWSDTDKHYSTDSSADTGNNVYGCIKKLFLLKKKNHNLKFLLSIGGWSYSSNLRTAFETEGGRQKCADSFVELLKNLGFDGIDVDFEYPSDYNEADQFVDTLRRLRLGFVQHPTQVDAISCSLLHPMPREHLVQMDQYLVFWNLMAYDYAGSWDTVACQAANLHASKSNLASTPSTRTKRSTTFTDTHGPGQPYNGIGIGSWEKGVRDYRALPQQGCAVTNRDQEAASYCYNSGSRLFISYDTPEIARKKGEYIKSKGLGGGMWWELSGDKKGDDSLVTMVVNTVGGTGALDKSENLLS
ncbi:hypothetical protein N7489_011721 [Penicillium chrysogenum]|uniref:uncharacterized protein n=1 Tax=Penicillium chrysogenum TaxID=5076 RepID=UPI0024DF21B3|nr:uncharacterized protein N7489_011721 [Penicillium chrysogenum]KAJ5231013.1 hypothetical protein N7489_011721 [Penicillium chrysogenum]